MFRSAAALAAAVTRRGGNQVYAQESAPGPGLVEVTVIPAWWAFFTNKAMLELRQLQRGARSSRTTSNRISRRIEGEVSSSSRHAPECCGWRIPGHAEDPNTVSYTGNLVLSAPTTRSVVPYAIGGVGGFTLLEKASLGINTTETFLHGQRRRRRQVVRPERPLGCAATTASSRRNRRIRRPCSFGQDHPVRPSGCSVP